MKICVSRLCPFSFLLHLRPLDYTPNIQGGIFLPQFLAHISFICGNTLHLEMFLHNLFDISHSNKVHKVSHYIDHRGKPWDLYSLTPHKSAKHSYWRKDRLLKKQIHMQENEIRLPLFSNYKHQLKMA